MLGPLARRLDGACSYRGIAPVGVALLALILFSAPAEAQSWMPSWVPPWASSYLKNIGAGVSVTRVVPVESKVDPLTTKGVTVGFAPQARWGFVIGFGAFRSKVRINDVEIGELGVSPLLGGVGYTWVRDRLALKASVAVGIVFNHVSINSALLAQASDAVTVDVGNCFGGRLTFGAEYAFVPKVALRGAVNYTPLRPSFVARTSQGEIRGSWNATSTSFQAAFVVYPLR